MTKAKALVAIPDMVNILGYYQLGSISIITNRHIMKVSVPDNEKDAMIPDIYDDIIEVIDQHYPFEQFSIPTATTIMFYSPDEWSAISLRVSATSN